MNIIKTFFYILFFSMSCFGQDIFQYEKKIQNIENYNATDLEFFNSKEKIKLYGTLIAPKNHYDKIIIVVPGSGMDTRNNHYQLTENLLQNNIAVFRYDERGVGKSEGKFSTANYTITDMANDLRIIYDSLKNNIFFSSKKIGFISHSQGGMVTMILIENGVAPDFLVQWAAPVQKYGEFLKYQLKTGVNKFENELIFDSEEKKLEIMDIFHQAFGGSSTENDWKEDLKISKEALKKAKEHGYTEKNFNRFYYCNFYSLKHILKRDFENTYARCKIPILYIIGSNDLYLDPKAEVNKLRSFQNSKIEIIVFNGLNHYLTKEDLSTESMYNIDAEAKKTITNWILKQ